MASEGKETQVVGFERTELYKPRPIRSLDLLQRDGWQLKAYAVTYGPDGLQRGLYDEGMALAWDDLPRPAVSARRPGIGFVIFHQGRRWHYLVLNWWDNENEYFNRVYVRRRDAAEVWRRAGAGEAACVWDLQIVWFEREAYVRHVLAPHDGPHLDRYLRERLNIAD